MTYLMSTPIPYGAGTREHPDFYRDEPGIDLEEEAYMDSLMSDEHEEDNQ